MKIVDVCAFYAPKGGGVRTYVDRKLKAGEALGHEIVVIAPGKRDEVEHRGERSKIVWLRSPTFPLDFNYRYFDGPEAVHATLDREAPDVVEASSPWRSSSIVAEWSGAAPRALILHADPLSAYAYRWFDPIAPREMIDKAFSPYWRHLRNMDAAYDVVISASEGLTRRMREGGLTRVMTNPMGVDPGIFSPDHADPALRRSLLEMCSLDENATLLMGVGRFAPEKRWPMVIDAVTAAGRDHPVGLVLVGAGRDRRAIQRAVRANPHVRLLGPVGDRALLARLLASADALVHGCEAETFCMVGAEAAASGLPLIVPDAGGAADHARCAGSRIYRANDLAAATEAISDFIAARSHGFGACPSGEIGVRSMDDHFTDLFATYDRLLRPKRAAA